MWTASSLDGVNRHNWWNWSQKVENEWSNKKHKFDKTIPTQQVTTYYLRIQLFLSCLLSCIWRSKIALQTAVSKVKNTFSCLYWWRCSTDTRDLSGANWWLIIFRSKDLQSEAGDLRERIKHLNDMVFCQQRKVKGMIEEVRWLICMSSVLCFVSGWGWDSPIFVS